MKRHFILHIGPTNSGKTFCALERLKTAQNGVYLGPLRLLALEVYEKMKEYLASKINKFNLNTNEEIEKLAKVLKLKNLQMKLL